MPRIYTSSNDPLDFCLLCFPEEDEADEDEELHRGEGPDGRGDCYAYDAVHPDYGFERYRCYKCGLLLTPHDD
jgi:hypothetical protein